MVMTTADPVGIVGAGAMGLPIVRYLTEAGFRVLCWDLDPGRLNDAVTNGGEAASGPADLGVCRALLVFVPTDEDVRSVALEFAEVASPGAYFVIHSSVRTQTCRALTEELAPAGIKVVDAALTGGVRGARAGEINLLVGGAAEDVAALEPVFAPWTSHVNHLGPSGNGQIGKTVNNMIHWGQIVCIVEALSLGLELGLKPEQMRPALYNGPTDSRTLRELEEMRFTWYEKDTDNAVEMASDIDRKLYFSEIVRTFMRSINVANVAALLDGESVVELPEITI
ncbi:NAD(P)-dependent oxidoreductase [Micromonospora sp. NPDC023966]|uniref:NAD(P)-dependent oxidoreductase n=1 Tax=Micromonospora sp. NPDC023966 TaxID=3154699 RepID=UPI0033F6B63A